MIGYSNQKIGDFKVTEMDRYAPGVPCWVDTLQPDPRAAMAFYRGVFGWEPAEADHVEYFVGRLRGRDVAGIAAQPPDTPRAPSWLTYVRVDSADAAAAAAQAVGGTVEAGPFDVPPAGRMAALADPAGARFCVWEPGERQGAQLVNEPSAWAMSMLNTPDPEGAAAFYGELFGWTTEAFGPITMFRLPGYVGGPPEQPVSREVVAAMMPGDGPAHWSVDFWIADADAAAAAAAQLGGRVVSPPADSPLFRSAVLADPSGVMFSVSQKLA
jgi:predicted enzyme related to lactoylglutathione lyase